MQDHQDHPKKKENNNREQESCISHELLTKYFDLAHRALNKISFGDERVFVWEEAAEDFLDMAQRYISDAHYFLEKGDSARAFACLNYAHGWLDAGARLGLFDVGGDNTLFTVDSSNTDTLSDTDDTSSRKDPQE